MPPERRPKLRRYVRLGPSRATTNHLVPPNRVWADEVNKSSPVPGLGIARPAARTAAALRYGAEPVKRNGGVLVSGGTQRSRNRHVRPSNATEFRLGAAVLKPYDGVLTDPASVSV